MLCRIIVAVVASLACGGAAARAADKPAPPPEKSGSKAEPAKQTPADPDAELRSTLKALAKALQDGDRAGIRHVIHATNPTERKMVEAMAAMAAEIAQLYKASAKAFGEEQAKGLTGDLAAELTRIDEAEISIDGDAATVRYAATSTTKPASSAGAPNGDDEDPSPPPAAPLVLKKLEGRWQVPVAELSKDTTPEEIEQRLGDLEAQTKVIAELSGEIAKGKYKSAEKAAEAWQAKMMQALAPRGKRDGEQGEKKGDAEKPK